MDPKGCPAVPDSCMQKLQPPPANLPNCGKEPHRPAQWGSLPVVFPHSGALPKAFSKSGAQQAALYNSGSYRLTFQTKVPSQSVPPKFGTNPTRSAWPWKLTSGLTQPKTLSVDPMTLWIPSSLTWLQSSVQKLQPFIRACSFMKPCQWLHLPMEPSQPTHLTLQSCH